MNIYYFQKKGLSTGTSSDGSAFYCASQVLAVFKNGTQDPPPAERLRLALSRHSLCCAGLEPNSQNLPRMPAFGSFSWGKWMQLAGVLEVADHTKLCLVAEEKPRSVVLSCCHASVTALWFSESSFRLLWALAWAVANPRTRVFYCFRDFKASVVLLPLSFSSL